MPDYLQSRWARTMKGAQASFAGATGLFSELLACYQQPGRFYHGPQHLLEAFQALDQLACSVPDQPELELALWWHDAHLIPGDPLSEQLSGELAFEAARGLGLSPQRASRVQDLVLCTGQLPSTPDLTQKLIRDVDRWVWSAPEARYQGYARQVRLEYGAYSDAAYLAGRQQFLLEALDGPVYLSGAFQERIPAALTNLRHEAHSVSEALEIPEDQSCNLR